MDAPNPIAVAISILRVLATVSRPTFGADVGPSSDTLAGVLRSLEESGMKGLVGRSDDLDTYLRDMSDVEARSLTRDHALAFWINVYNAGALRLATSAAAAEVPSVLRIPGGFSTPFITIDGEALSMDAIEHAKIRRFKDPRIHGALVCGSVSCPTLRRVPYTGEDLDTQLEHQIRAFLDGGGARYDATISSLELSRVFLWYGGDFVRSRRMPTFVPVSKRQLVAALATWLDDVPEDVSVSYQPYDWGLRCAVG